MSTPLSGPVLETAVRILASQSMVPPSPAALDSEGAISLCLAGAIAKAGLLHNGLAAHVPEMEAALIRTGSKAPIAAVFRSLGWPLAICRSKMEVNDAAPASSRKRVVIAVLRRDLALNAA